MEFSPGRRTTRFLLKYNKRDTKDKQLEQRRFKYVQLKMNATRAPTTDAQLRVDCQSVVARREVSSSRRKFNSNFKLWLVMCLTVEESEV